MNNLIQEFRWRGFLSQTTNEEIEQYMSERRTVYVGFDPTARSLHLGSLIPVMALAHAQRCGHRPIILVGGGTGLIGDPSGKTTERVLLTNEQVEANARGMHQQLSRFLDLSTPDSAIMLNNADWLCQLNLLEFLRDIGKHFSVNEMIKRDSVRMRLEERDHGISYTEFSYMLLQAYDFYHLAQHHGCTVQMGGSDQWGNILSGKELIRRVLGQQAEGITFPLLTTSTGKKFGKTEEGAVWLDADLTSPYQMYQYWIQTADADVIAHLKLFTFLSEAEIAALEGQLQARPEGRAAQKALARECTAIVHGAEVVHSVELASQILFGAGDVRPDRRAIELLRQEVPSSDFARRDLESGVVLIDLLVRTGLAESKGAARRLAEGGGLYINNRRIGTDRKSVTMADVEWPDAILLRAGKKQYHLLVVQ